MRVYHSALLIAENSLGPAVLQLSQMGAGRGIWTCLDLLRKVPRSPLRVRYKMEEEMGSHR